MQRTLLLLAITACGDNNNRPDAGDTDPMIDAAPAPPRAVVVSGDFVTPGFSGVMSALDIESMQMTQNVAPAGAIGNDPMLRRIGGELFVVNRSDGNSVTILDAQTFALKEQLGTGAGSNPQDVATYADKLFIPAFGTKGVVVATRGSTTTKLIDLSALDPDGLPNCMSAYRAGNDIYVACDLLDAAFQPRGNAKVVVIDGPSATVRATLTLSTPNPLGAFTELPNNLGLVIPTFQFGMPTTRCLERIQTGIAPVALGCLVQHATLGGYVAASATSKMGEANILWMIASDGGFPVSKARLWGYDLGTSMLWPTPVTPDTQELSDVVGCPDGTLVVADKTMAANGLRVYANNIERTTTPLAVGLRPQSSPAIVCY